MNKTPPNLKQIAELAGVSVMTASRALRNQPYVSTDTREKVQQIARELDYRPNPLVSALMSSRRNPSGNGSLVTIGYLTNYPTRRGWAVEPLFLHFFEGAQEAALQHGYKLEEFWLRESGMAPQRISQILFNRGIMGLVVAPLPVAQGHLRLDWDRFATVALGHSLAKPSVHRFTNHQFRSMRLVMRQLRQLGYRRIGLALPASLNQRVTQLWLGGYLVEPSRPGSTLIPPLLLKDRDWGEARFAQWIRDTKPDAVISHSYEPMEWLDSLGIKVPDDLGFVYLNCETQDGPISGIYQNGAVVGRAAVEFLISMIQRNERGIPALAHSILIDGSWVEGSTVRRVRDRPSL
jgi:LacI family transcriptional regulator